MKTRSSVLKTIGIAAATAALAACGQNPFPNDGRITQGQIDEPPYRLEAPEKVECVSDAPCEFKVTATVLAEMGAPVLRAADLPAGAKFNYRGGAFRWTPRLLDREVERNYTMFVLLSSTGAPADFGKARAIQIHVTAASPSITEEK